MHRARGGAPEGERNGNYRHGARTKEAIAVKGGYGVKISINPMNKRWHTWRAMISCRPSIASQYRG